MCTGMGQGRIDGPELGAPGTHFPLLEVPPKRLGEIRGKRGLKVVGLSLVCPWLVETWKNHV